MRVSGFWFRISSFCFSGIGFQNSGFGFRAFDFGFLVSGFGFRELASNKAARSIPLFGHNGFISSYAITWSCRSVLPKGAPSKRCRCLSSRPGVDFGSGVGSGFRVEGQRSRQPALASIAVSCAAWCRVWDSGLRVQD